MRALLTQLQHCLEGHVCLIGLGHPDKADDAAGLRLAEAIAGRLSGASAEPACSGATTKHPLVPGRGEYGGDADRFGGGRHAKRPGAYRGCEAAEGGGRSADGVVPRWFQREVLPAPSERAPCLVREMRGPSAFGSLEVWLIGTELERHLHHFSAGNRDHVIFLDAADFGAEPGAVALLDRVEMRARFPQCSTHRLSLGLVADMLEGGGFTRAWLLAVQPKNLRSGDAMSAEVRRTVEALSHWILGAWSAPRAGRSPCVPELA